MSNLSLVRDGTQALLILKKDGEAVQVLLPVERLLAVGDAAVHVATGVTREAVVRLPDARWFKNGAEVL